MRNASRRTGREPRWWPRPDGSWFIGVVALGLAVAAVFEFVRAGDADRGPDIAAAVSSNGARAAPIDLHRLLPDATNGIGALIRVHGTVVAGDGNGGFWVRDLRDNVVLIGEADAPVPGTTVRITGVLAPLPPGDPVPEGPAHPSAGEHALILRDLKVRPSADGVEVLDRP